MIKIKELFGLVVIFLCSNIVYANQTVCVFDLLGRAGESYKLNEEWALEAKKWGANIKLIAFQKEDVAAQAFEDGKCDGVVMTTMRSREYNKFAGSIDALGGVTSNEISRKAIQYVLDERNAKRLVTERKGQKYEVVGIIPLGIAYIFTHDRNQKTIEDMIGKKFAYLHYDSAQKIAIEKFGSVSVPSDISNFVKKFIAKDVDLIASPAYAYKPLEIQKGLGQNGAMMVFPVVNITVDLIIRPDKFPANFPVSSRAWYVKQLPKMISVIRRMENEIPAKYKVKIEHDNSERYQKLLREVRIELTKKGIYDRHMMRVLKKSRCVVEPSNFECSLMGE